MQLNKGLNLDTHPSNVETGDFRYARNISLDNTKQYLINEKGLQSLGIEVLDLAGTIPYDKGIVLFANTNCIYVINTSLETEVIEKTIYIPQITFLKEKPIRGTYTYNQNKDLIICFSSGVEGNFEDKIINIDLYEYVNGYKQLSDKEYYRLDINPNVKFPEITSSIITGNLMTGSYQIAVSYYLDKEYTNHSLLSLPVYIYGTSSNIEGTTGLAPNQISTKGIRYDFLNLDTNYDYFRISVIYNDGTSFAVYNTSKITTSTSTFIIDNFTSLTKGSLDETLINSIFYSNSESMSVMNNRLYRANIKGKSNKNLDSISNDICSNCRLILNKIELNVEDISKDVNYIKFQSEEVYMLYLTLGDKKGNVLGSYPITSNYVDNLIVEESPNQLDYISISNNITLYFKEPISREVQFTLLAYEDDIPVPSKNIYSYLKKGLQKFILNNTHPEIIKYIFQPSDELLAFRGYRIPNENATISQYSPIKYYTNDIIVTLPEIREIFGTPEELEELNNIGFFTIHRAIRNNSNSRIFTQGISCAQIEQSLGYKYPLNSNTFLQYINPEVTSNTTSYGGYLSSHNEILNDDVNVNEYNKPATNFRFYSFEDLYNKSDNINVKEYDIVGEYSYNMLLASSGNKNLYRNFGELKRIKKGTVKNTKLLEGNNLNALNLGLESCRTLETEIITTNNGLDPQDPDYAEYYDYTNNPYYFSDIQSTLRCKLHRINLINNVSKYYKNIYDETLVLASPIKEFFLTDYYNNSSITCIGDTFYNIFELSMKRYYLDWVKGYTLYGSVDYYFKSKLNAYDLILPTNDTNKREFKFTTFVESKYNIHARYWEGNYPDWEQPINTATQTGYNKVYNLQNTQNATTIVDINNNDERNLDKGLYPSRIIMSKTKSQESNVLNFRKYLALDYYDMPYNRNAIVSLNSTYKNLYIQQELALSVASVKDIISYQEGATYVGSGQLFDRIPTEVIPTGYGFLGCESYFNTGITDIGLWVIDAVQSLIALITDDNIKIISNGKNQNWFNNKLKGKNPYINQGSFITYDNSDKEVKRLILTNHINNITLSYYPIIENWFCFHTYIPKIGLYTRNNTYYFFERTIDNLLRNRLFKYSDYIKSRFSDLPTVYESIISIYFNEDKGLEKLFESIYWQTKFIIDSVNIYDKTFTSMFVHNDSQSTRIINIGDNVEWFNSENGVYKNDVWILNDLFDYVKDNKKPFLADFVNFVNTNMDLQKEWFDISKLISIFACVTMIFDNYYYSVDGKTKSIVATVNEPKQPTLLLNDLSITYKKVNR